MGPAPLPWDIPVDPGDKFVKAKDFKMEVPHTASVKVRFTETALEMKDVDRNQNDLK